MGQTVQLNSTQEEAVRATEGPVLILAGAGSGKTRVLVHRIAYLIDEIGVLPGNICAITFTNKAAGEMRERVDSLIGFGSRAIQVSTFHSLCVRILRDNAELLGFTRSFAIYDTDDQISLMKDILRRRNLDPKRYKEKTILHAVSSAKDELVGPEKYREINGGDFWSSMVADLYAAYQQRLMENNAMDFDDLLVKTVELFENRPEVLERYQDRYQYLMVDEYQDTNTAQFRFVSLLAKKYRNLCVVGDDDQSIYRFRGANIRNILNFEKVFPDAKVVRLEQNYRSTQRILQAANEVIRHNRGRKEKTLWTENEPGEKVRLRQFPSGFEEASFVASEIVQSVRSGKRKFGDFAVLYRTNAQSRLFEEKLLMLNAPYRIVGGVNFYSRREIKDILAYLKTVDNAQDDVAVRRIINVPKRGIGATTLSRLDDYAEAGGISFFEAACRASDVPKVSASAARKVEAFTDFIALRRAKAEDLTISGLIREILEATGYSAELKAEDTEDSEARLENLDELINKAVQYETQTEDPTLSGFLEEVALISDLDSVEDGDDRVLLMTLHAAKGLEFPAVYMTGMEEGLFPGSMSIHADDPDSEIEEERRLAYVGITRAKEQLTLTAARQRMIRGDMVESPLSRFVREIPRDQVDTGDAPLPSGRALHLSGGGFDPAMKKALTESAYSPKPSFGRTFEPSAFSGSGKRYQNPYRSAVSRPEGKTGIDYNVGDTVRHVKFGEGVVREIRDGGRDYEVTVDFEKWGVKKMFASFAKLQKLE